VSKPRTRESDSTTDTCYVRETVIEEKRETDARQFSPDKRDVKFYFSCTWPVGKRPINIEVIQLSFGFPSNCFEKPISLTISVDRQAPSPDLIAQAKDAIEMDYIHVLTVKPHHLNFLHQKHVTVQCSSNSMNHYFKLWRREQEESQWSIVGTFDDKNKTIQMTGFCDLCMTKHKNHQEF